MKNKLTDIEIEFNELHFMRLFLANLSNKGIYTINEEELSYNLYNFYVLEQYNKLFESYKIKGFSNKYVDIKKTLHNAFLCDLITQVDSNGNNEITISNDYYNQMKYSYNKDYINKMDSLTDEYVVRTKVKTKKLLTK